MVDLIDYGGGNVGSMRRCLDRLGVAYNTVGDGDALRASKAPVVFPGVGAFGAVMQSLNERELTAALQDELAGGRPLLGVCVGLQVLFESSQESPNVPGLGIFEGQVIRFARGKVPQIGWNRVSTRTDWPEGHAYFVNSYVAEPKDRAQVLYTADYHGIFCAGMRRGNITALQFHPEKSGNFGHSLVQRWLDGVGAAS